MKRFCIGDIHGNYKGLKEILELSKFSYEEDLLIFLGDICDRGPDTFECIEELLKIKNLIYILGNHEIFFKEYIETNKVYRLWIENGGGQTLESYANKIDLDHNDILNANCNVLIPKSHRDLLDTTKTYYIIDNMIFIHGGYTNDIEIEKHNEHMLCWSRDLAYMTHKKYYNHVDFKYGTYDKIFLGHTPTVALSEKYTKPIIWGNVILLDTGSIWNRISMIDIDTNEIIQSSLYKVLYTKTK